jgi:hypothetical protein
VLFRVDIVHTLASELIFGLWGPGRPMRLCVGERPSTARPGTAPTHPSSPVIAASEFRVSGVAVLAGVVVGAGIRVQAQQFPDDLCLRRGNARWASSAAMTLYRPHCTIAGVVRGYAGALDEGS